MKTEFVSRRLAVIGTLLLGLGIVWSLSIRHSAKANPLFATITVNTTADTVAADGQCSLREAMQAANTNTVVNECAAGVTGLDTIEFNLGTGTPTINVLSALPQISQPLFINGNTGGATRVELNGAGAGSNFGLNLGNTAGGSTVQALVINRFGSDGIILQPGSNGCTIRGCIIGLDVTGTISQGNANGITVTSSNNIIGGTTATARNIISGNRSSGISLFATSNSNNTVQGNFIGTDINGTASLGNAIAGVAIVSGRDNLIGGTTAGAANVISGNRTGVDLGRSLSANLVQGNLIGTNAAGTSALGNTGNGIFVGGANNIIGGSTAGASNVIAFNNQNGVMAGNGTGNQVLTNVIFSNGALGIDLTGDGVTPNDAGDGDTGSNNLQNFPVLTAASSSGGNMTIQGTLNSTAHTAFRIEFFSNPSCDASGNGEGQVFLGFANVTTNGSGDAAINVTLPVNVALGHVVAATATDAGNNTSEFSACVNNRAANQPPAITANAQTRQAGSPAANLTIATVSDNEQAAGTLQVRINNGASAASNGVTVSNLNVSATGVVTADVVVACNTQSGFASFTLTVTDNANATASATLSVRVSPNTPPVLSYNNQTVAVGGALTVNPASTPSDNGGIASFALLSVAPNMLGSAPVVNNTSGAVTISNARPAGAYTVTVRATDNCGAMTDASFTLMINCPTITVGPESLPPLVVGQSYNQQLTASGGTGTVSFAVTSGALPNGLTLAADGKLSGTTNASGSFSFTVTVTDSLGCSGTRTFTLNIGCASITLNPASLPGGKVGEEYRQTITAAGGSGAYSFTSTGTLPTGLTFSSGGVLSGTPTQTGTFPLTIKATDTSGCLGTTNYTLTINCQFILVHDPFPLSPPLLSAGTAYHFSLSQVGALGAVTWSISAGSLPAGLTLNATTGVISGTPTTAGTSNFTIKITDVNGCMSMRDTRVIVVCSFAISPVGQTFTASGGTGTVNVSAAATGCPWSASSNASWLTVTPSSGNGNATVNLTVAANTGAPRTGTLTIAGQTFTATQKDSTPEVTSVSAASYSPNMPLARVSIVAAFGANLATSTLAASTLPLPTTLGGTTVKIKDSGGEEQNAPLFFVSPTQINYLLPNGFFGGTASVSVTGDNGEVLAIGSLDIAGVAPGLFTANASGQGVPSGVVLRVSPAGAQTYEPLARFDADLGRFVAAPIDLGPVGEQVFLIVFGTGFRNRRFLDVVFVTLGGLDVPVTYAGAQGDFAGLDQLNLGPLPRDFSGRGNVDLLLRAEGKTANVVQVNIK